MTAATTRPYLTRDRRDLLGAVGLGRVYRSLGGCDMRMQHAGQNRRVDRRLRELVAAGWVELGPDGRAYVLTGDGEADLLAAGGAPCSS